MKVAVDFFRDCLGQVSWLVVSCDRVCRANLRFGLDVESFDVHTLHGRVHEEAFQEVEPCLQNRDQNMHPEYESDGLLNTFCTVFCTY